MLIISMTLVFANCKPFNIIIANFWKDIAPLASVIPTHALVYSRKSAKNGYCGIYSTHHAYIHVMNASTQNNHSYMNAWENLKPSYQTIHTL